MDKYAELRAALDAGPTPGPWGVQSSNSWRRIGTPRGDGDVLSTTLQADGHPDLSARPETLAYIAACHPEAIRALLAERDALREVLLLARDRIESERRSGEFDPLLRDIEAALAQEAA